MSDKSSKRDCPICASPTVEAYTPFCSERCREVDLNRWLSNGYFIPGNQADDESDGLSSKDGPELGHITVEEVENQKH